MPRELQEKGGRTRTAEVVVVGAGPVGLMIANLLGLAGIHVVVLERNTGLLGLPRAIAYDAETLRLFAQVGLYGAIAPGLIQDPHVRHLNARKATLMAADFPRGPYGHSSLGTFYQPDFERALLEGLRRFPNVSIFFEHVVTGLEQRTDKVAIEGATPGGPTRVEARYVVACDGGASGMRERMGVKLVGSTYAERWLVVDAIAKNHGVKAITFNCDPKRPRVELPAVGDRVRWEFMQLPGEDESVLKSDATIRALVAETSDIPSFEIERRAVYTFHARVADRWRVGRAFLAGDAAHLMPPFAGQGMNSGMKDAANLCWKLAVVLKGQASEDILDSYEAERAPVVRRMVDVSRRLGAVIMPTSRVGAAARDTLFAFLNLSSRFRAFIRRGGVVPSPSISRSALTGRNRTSVIGQMAPQPTVRSGQQRLPLDELLEPHQWMGLGLGIDPTTLMSSRDLATLDALGARFICVNGASSDPRTLSLACDDPVFAGWERRAGVAGILVRPDRFIADRLDPKTDLEVLTPFTSVLSAAEPRLAA
jgi:3-(3-hydroxy-phenyl)propionate hydroxylase